MAPRHKILSEDDLDKMFKKMSKTEATAFLKGHHLLKTCSKKSSEPDLPNVGQMVWARAHGSAYWPGFLAELQDVDDGDSSSESTDIEDDAYTFVIFLEETFRYAPVFWENVIPVQDLELQKVLVNKYNRLVLKPKKGPTSFSTKALLLLQEFWELPSLERQRKAELNFRNREASKNKNKSSTTATPAKKVSESTSEEETPAKTGLKDRYKEKINLTVSESKKRKKKGLRVSDRLVTKQVDQLKTESKVATATKKTENKKATEEKPAEKPKPLNKNARPAVGGEVMREWARSRFEKLPKQYSFELNSNPPPCNKCEQAIENAEDLKTCHGLPHHNNCLETDGTAGRKCKMCIDQLCFICRKPSDGGKIAHKCSRCDLRFHIDCLTDWPQAEIQGSNGPITCPVHFCHTCLGDQKINGKFRDFTTNPSRAYHCLHCLSTYHKCCLPAGCGEDIRGKDYIVCPKHKLPNLKVTQRRIGCIHCCKNIKKNDKDRVECQFCIQVFHPECIGYTGEIKEKFTLDVFANHYKCYSCKWGLFPLYGQVVWFQQPQSQYWPARILYPSEVKARSAAKREPGQYSIEYFGTTSFYDNASRALPLQLTTIERFQIMKVYQDTPKILRAHEEATFFFQFVEAFRDKMLPLPKPVYKKIERNAYRNVNPAKVKEPTDVCSCWEDLKAEFVCAPESGCTNRDMEMECSDRICKGGKRCSNRMFVERKNDDEFLEKKLFAQKGWGVVAKKDFQPGDFVAEYRGEVIDRHEMQWRLQRKEEEDPMYLFEMSKELFIDAEYIGNMSRLINHSCDPNCVIRKYLSLGKSVGGIFAKGPIKVGDEVTFDYGCGTQSTAPFQCRCGSSKCVLFVGKEVPEGYNRDEEVENVDMWDDVCFKCSFGGRLICCDFDGCEKVWHYQCVGLSRAPRQHWYCPEHPVNAVKSIMKKLLGGEGKNVKPKVSNGKVGTSNSNTSEPKKKTSISKTSASAPNGKKTVNGDKVEPPTAKKGQKRKSPPAEDKEEEKGNVPSVQPPQKRRRTSVSAGNKKEDDASIQQNGPTSGEESQSSAPRKLRSSTSSRSQDELNDLNGKKDQIVIRNNVEVVLKPLPPIISPMKNTRRRFSGAATIVGTRPTGTLVGTRSRRKRRTQSCSPEGRRLSNGNRRRVDPSAQQSSVVNDNISVQAEMDEIPLAQIVTPSTQGVNSPAGGSSNNRRSRLRSQGSTKGSEPLTLLNHFLNHSVGQVRVEELQSNGDVSNDKETIIRMMTRSSSGALTESQTFDQNAAQTVISNGTSHNQNVEDIVTGIKEEIDFSDDGDFHHCAMEIGSPSSGRRKRIALGYESSDASDSSSPARFEIEYSEVENDDGSEVEVEYENRKIMSRRPSRQQYTVEK